MTRLLLAALVALAAFPASAGDFSRAAAGTAGSEFLLLDTSARGIALGGAMTAVTNDAASIYWNPAGLTGVPRLSATAMHARYVADITYNAGAVAARVNDTSVMAAGGRFLDAGKIDRTDVNGLQTGVFRPTSYVGELAWGQSIYDLSDSEMDVSMGAAARAIQTDLGGYRAIGYAGDIGVLSRFYSAVRTYDVGMVVQNLGIGQRFDEVRDTMPTRVRFGAAVKPVRPLTLTIEGVAPFGGSMHGAAGAEFELDLERGVKGALRAGFNSLTYQSLGPASAFSFGFGVGFSDLGIDYAFAPMGPLGTQTHRISISYNLPAKVSRRYRER